MGLALMALIWLITLISTYFFVAKTWWLPVGASTATQFIDSQFTLTFIIMGVVFLAAQLGLGYIVWKYKETPKSPPGVLVCTPAPASIVPLNCPATTMSPLGATARATSACPPITRR